MKAEVRWIADEMVGRLARYLRFLGYDVLYAKGIADRAILELAVSEDRIILTRDVLLAKRGGRKAILLRSLAVEQQLLEVRQGFPGLRGTVTFVRCSTCNGPLTLADRSTPEAPKGVPPDVWTSSEEVHLCTVCRQPYWEGTHTRDIRRTFERVFGTGKDPIPPEEG